MTAPTRRRRRDPNSFKRPNATQRVLDILSTDGGWLSKKAIQAQCGHKDMTIDLAISNLRNLGAIESRIVELAAYTTNRPAGRGTSRIETYTEWRALVDWIED